jgi:hypothetical protein
MASTDTCVDCGWEEPPGATFEETVVLGECPLAAEAGRYEEAMLCDDCHGAREQWSG